MADSVVFVTWRSQQTHTIHPIGRLRTLRPLQGQSLYEFVYVQGVHKALTEGFAPFVSFPSLDTVYRSESLFPLFANRLMAASRPDYPVYLERLGLNDAAGAEPLAVLARSGGARSTDRLEIIAPPSYDQEVQTYQSLFLVRGVGHIPHAEERVASLQPNEPLLWMLDRQNPIDPKAVALRTQDSCLIGYLPFYLVEDAELLTGSPDMLTVTVRKVNLPPAPIHVRVLCELQARDVPSFTPFAAKHYQPVPATPKLELGPSTPRP